MLAQEEAERSRHSYIGTEHLLVGILREHDGMGARVLRNLSVDTAKVRAAIESALGRNQRILIQQLVPTSRVKKVIEISFEESRRMGHDYVGTEHLLLGLLLEGEGIAAHVLADLGVTTDNARTELEGLLRGEPIESHPKRPRSDYRVGERVLVHDPKPPYRLSEGRVVRVYDTRYEIAFLGDIELAIESANFNLIHPIPMTWTRDCPFCAAQ